MSELNQLLSRKLQKLLLLLQETERMGKLLENNDLDALNLCISKKHGYIEDIDVLDRHMESLPQREDNNTVRLRTEIHKALEALMVQDKANHGKAESMKGFFISQIRDINRERNLQAYTPNSGDSVFVDREG